MRVLGGDGVVRPCYRLPGHVVMVLEEGEKGQVQNYASATETSKRADVFCSRGVLAIRCKKTCHAGCGLAGWLALRLPALQCWAVFERSLRVAHGNLSEKQCRIKQRCLTMIRGQVACCLHLGKFNEAKLCKCILHAVRFP